MCSGFPIQAHLIERVRQVVVGADVVCINRKRPAKGGARLITPIQLGQDGAQIIPGVAEPRVHFDGLPIPLDCLRTPTQGVQNDGEVETRLSVRTAC
jgi:hypothetical protein